MTEMRSNHFGPSCAALELRDCFYFGGWSWIEPVLINEWRWTWEEFFLGGSRWFEPVLGPLHERYELLRDDTLPR